jgi:hypothetical protein
MIKGHTIFMLEWLTFIAATCPTKYNANGFLGKYGIQSYKSNNHEKIERGVKTTNTVGRRN